MFGIQSSGGRIGLAVRGPPVWRAILTAPRGVRSDGPARYPFGRPRAVSLLTAGRFVRLRGEDGTAWRRCLGAVVLRALDPALRAPRGPEDRHRPARSTDPQRCRRYLRRSWGLTQRRRAAPSSRRRA